MKRSTILLISLLLTAAAGAGTLATVGEDKITSADVIAAEGTLPTGEKLAIAVENLIQRTVILNLARGKGLQVTDAELDRAATLSARAYGPRNTLNDAAWRRYLAQDILIVKYINLYVYPRVNPTDEDLLTFFIAHGGEWEKGLPIAKDARANLFGKYRNETLYYYTRAAITRILEEDGTRARTALKIETYY